MNNEGESKAMLSDFAIVAKNRDKLAEALKAIRTAVGSAHLFQTKEKEHEQMNNALQEINEILEGVGF